MNTNKLLLIIAVSSVLLAIILIPMIIFKPWIPVDPLYVSGKVFYLRVTEPLVSDEIVFSGKSQSGELTTFRIKPGNPNNKLAKVDVELTNHSNSTVKILIDDKSTELITNKQEFFKPLDSVEESEAIDKYIETLEYVNKQMFRYFSAKSLSGIPEYMLYNYLSKNY